MKGALILALCLAMCQITEVLALTKTQEGCARALITIKVDLSKHGSNKEARLWIPYPVSDSYQDISKVTVKTTADEWAVYTERTWKNAIFYARWHKGPMPKTLSLSFQVKRKKRSSTVIPALLNKKACFDQKYFSTYLKASSLAPVGGQVTALASKITAGKNDMSAKAAAIYDWVVSNMSRDPGVKGCGTGNVCLLLGKRSGKCTDIHSVFVALLKAAGIPAREVFGLRLGQEGTTDITRGQHCWAEFYIPGSGWIASDPGDYLKMVLEKGLDPSSAKAQGLKKLFLGTVDQYRVRLGIGRDIVLNPPQSSAPLNYFMYPYGEIDGRPLDFLDAHNFSYQITCKTMTGRNNSP